MNVVIIGGTYLVPRLVEAGYSVTNVSRGERDPYQGHSAWKRVNQITVIGTRKKLGVNSVRQYCL